MARTHTSALAGHLSELAEKSPPLALATPIEVIRLEEAVTEIEGADLPTPWNKAGAGA